MNETPKEADWHWSHSPCGWTVRISDNGKGALVGVSPFVPAGNVKIVLSDGRSFLLVVAEEQK